MLMRMAWLLGLLMACPVTSVAAAVDSVGAVPGMRSMHFRTYSVMQGLPQASATAIVQDNTGYFWIGTQDGLARFDGYEFKNYRHDRADPGSLSDNFVRNIVAGDDGGLWVTTRSGGINRYSTSTDNFEHIPVHHDQSVQSGLGSVSTLAMGLRQRLWIVSNDGVLQWLDADRTKVEVAAFGQQTSLRDARAMQALPDGSLLIGSVRGLFRVNAERRSIVSFGPPRLDVHALTVAADNSIWVGTADDGVFQLSLDGRVLKHLSRRATNKKFRLPDNEIRAILVDHRGLVWIAGNTAGLASFNPGNGKLRHFPHRASDPHSVAASRLSSLYEGRRGMLLVGSWTNGFSIHDPDTEGFLQIYSVPDDPRTLPAPPAMAVHGADDGSLWAGVIEGGGLVRIELDKGVTHRYTHDPAVADSLSNNAVRQVISARDGGLWVATSGGGLDHLRPDGSGFDHYRHHPDDPGSLAADTVLDIHLDSRGTLWVATEYRGISALCAGCSDFQQFRHVANDPYSLGSNAISAFLEGRDGGLWVATMDGGLDRLDRDSGHFEHFTAGGPHDSGLSVNSLSSIFEDSRGLLWVGTQGGGLNRQMLSQNGSVRFETIDQHSGLDSDAIGGILEDDAGRIWVSTLKGISRIDPKTNGVVNYSGHAGASKRGYWVNSATRLTDKRLVFGGLDGIVVFNPSVMPEPDRPQPAITDVRVGDKPLLRGWQEGSARDSMHGEGIRSIELEYWQNDLSFEFSALEYANPESIEYAYRLDGHDSAWKPVSWRRRIATYTELAPDLYTLSVRARSGHGEWGMPASLAFRIPSPPWRTPLAYTAYLLLALLVLCVASWRVRSNLADRRQVQKTIRDSEARLKLALWGSGTELWDLALDNGHMHRENALPNLEISTLERSQAPNDYLSYLHPDDRDKFRLALARHLKQMAPSFEASYRLLDSDGQWTWVLSRGQVVKRDERGQALRITGITSDINALKQAEEALLALNEDLESRVERRTQEVHARNTQLHHALDELTETQHKLLEAEKMAALGGLVAGVAHEINTPLGVALTASSFLRDETRRLSKNLQASDLDLAAIERFGRKAGDSADIIMRNLQGANRLINSFKQVAVAQSSEDIEPVELCECMEQIVVTLGPMIKKSPHKIELDCTPCLRVETSSGALYQIITNLVTNAIVHGFDGIDAGTIRIQARCNEQQVLLRFSDDGRGMSKEVFARLYEPFFTTRRGQGGSGLGLPIVYNLVTQVLQGTIEVHSDPGQGSEFEIRFPVGNV